MFRMGWDRSLFVCLLGVLMTAGCARQAEVIAHRGASYEAPENTLAAVRLAWEQGVDAVEVDVHLTADHQLAVIHDANTKRTAGADWRVSEQTLAELRTLDVGRWKGEQFAGQRIPTLEEVLELVPDGKKQLIEIKCKGEILPYLKKAVEKSGKRGQIVIICFDPDVLVQSKQRMPDIPVYWLVGTEKDKETGKPIPHSPNLIDFIREKGIDGLSVNYEGVDEAFARAVRKAGYDFYVWTVDDCRTAERMIRLGARGITTNHPARLKNECFKKR
ncbi:MAG TPA: glycerophosphodiester phosphodiesterase [Anaerohalosphaeraceae bacterium]|nr:glycerophosphodiester phosphodiesterase [Anaerohalosphaeraceae bacterium]HOL88043.1 glycerophosphodiester phosphodiesterase [Anaerohalosphaeraceae bacterium]HPP55291.1 glycerophosphodiester phosphodiesterase [Anaerohalosphaeraceae bacterium]